MGEALADPGVVRAVGLLAPVGAVGAAWRWRRPDTRLAAGALLATVWNLPALLAVHVAAEAFGWWRYDAVGGVVLGAPIDLLLGWTLLWGALPVLLFPAGPLALPVALLILVDVAFMPLAAPVVVLGDAWLAGEAAGVLVALVPALLLGRLTAAGRRLAVRAAMQVVLAGALLLWVLPILVRGTPAGLVPALTRLPPPVSLLAIGVLLLLALPGVAAVQEFAERGQGTPLPYDPPVRVVRSGPYAYFRNPMQTSVCLLLGCTAVVTGSAHLAAAAVVAFGYGAGLAWWHEGEELSARFGAAWTAYRDAAPAWRPRWRPVPVREPGTLWVAAGCELCAPVAAFIASRGPVGLQVRPAEANLAANPRRLNYEAGGRRWEGVAALARALEHLHAGWALGGWALRLPGVSGIVQLMVDAAGGGPRDLPACAMPEQHPVSGGPRPQRSATAGAARTS